MHTHCKLETYSRNNFKGVCWSDINLKREFRNAALFCSIIVVEFKVEQNFKAFNELVRFYTKMLLSTKIVMPVNRSFILLMKVESRKFKAIKVALILK